MHENTPDREPNTRKFRDTEEHSGSTRQGHRGAEGTKMRESPRGLQGPVRRSRAARGGVGAHSWDTTQRQANGAGGRDKRRILAGGG